jgi:hypothetical protein
MPGLTTQYGWHFCNKNKVPQISLRVFLVNIVGRFQSDIPTKLVSSGRLTHYGLKFGTRVENRTK